MTGQAAAPESFVFVVTYGRSGSTLLQKILNGIPGYCVRGENANGLLHIFHAWHAMTETRSVRSLRRLNSATDIDHPWHGAELINPDMLAHAMIKTFVDHVLNLPEGTRVGGFKEIRWHKAEDQFPEFMRFVHTYFPNAKVIVNTRNLDAVARSGWWAKQKPEQVKTVLGKAGAMFAAYREEFPDASISLHYDDYTGNPDAFIKLFDFLGETFDRDAVKAVLDTPLRHMKKSTERNKAPRLKRPATQPQL